MATSAQLTANRANSAQSTGPRSVEGKTQSSQNATRHGLTGNRVVLPGEDQAAFDRLEQALMDQFEPQDAIEEALVRTLAAASWKLERFRRIEHGIFTLGMEEHAGTVDPDRALTLVYLKYAAQLERLRRYQGRIEREHKEAMRRLDERQLNRIASEIGFVSHDAPPAAPRPAAAPQTPSQPAPQPAAAAAQAPATRKAAVMRR